MNLKKLNLGAGDKKYNGFLNLDKFKTFGPDIIHDLEIFPYPFIDSEIDEIYMFHILEHLGKNSDTYISIFKELFRICCNNALIHIKVPHPRHDDFLSDPTHVRPITLQGLELFDKELNLNWQKKNASNSRLALIHNINFKVIKAEIDLEKKYKNLLIEKKISVDEIAEYINQYNNVIKQSYFVLKVIK